MTQRGRGNRLTPESPEYSLLPEQYGHVMARIVGLEAEVERLLRTGSPTPETKTGPHILVEENHAPTGAPSLQALTRHRGTDSA